MSLILLGVRLAGTAQESLPIRIVRGDLVSWSGADRGGTVTLRNTDNRIFQCAFDRKTSFERENEPITISGTRPGDHLEIVADPTGHAAGCYARSVKVVDVTLPRKTAAGKPRFASHNNATELLAPRGNMTFSGVVTSIAEDQLTLRMRDRSTKTLLLRLDTRYLGAGLAQERSNLAPQTLVFIRAGLNLDGDVEAYTIVWGDLLEVRK